MITPTSAKSKQYQALGIDEIANDIETAFTAINQLEQGGGSDYTETIVNISSAEILAMGTSPIELLPAPGVGKYYDIEKIILEYTHVTTGYTDCTPILNDGAGYWSKELYDFTNEGANTFLILPFYPENWAVGQSAFTFQSGYQILNSGLYLTNNAIDPTDGDGTLRVKIYHKTITFGA